MSQYDLFRYDIQHPLKQYEKQIEVTTMENETKKPEYTYRAGNVSATVWKNMQEKDGKTFPVYSISVVKNYTDKEGNWKTTSSYKEQDMHKLALASEQAYQWVIENKQKKEE